MRSRIVAIYAVLAAGNLAAWGAALLAFHDHPVLLGTAFLAYGFGLRHAVDADHIAAIDNVTRALMQRGQRPVAVGFAFALGHSSVVVLATIAVAATAGSLEQRFPDFRDMGALIGTAVSAFFLFAIAAANLSILAALIRAFRRARRAGPVDPASLDPFLDKRGLLGRLFAPLLRQVRASWQMYPLGLLFGLGFDTASEIALLGIAAGEAAKGLALWSVLIFPALFTAGMALVDTSDGVLMLGAYGWAFRQPVRKLYYNLTVTLASVLVAVAVGGIELLGLVADRWNLGGPFWQLVLRLNDNFAGLGYLVIGFFAAAWLISALVWRLGGFAAAERSSATG